MNEHPTLQLSLGGVAFTLIPEDNQGTVTFGQEQQKEEVLLQLSNYSGTLRVSLSSSSSHVGSVTAEPVRTKTTINPITPKQRPLHDMGHNKRARLEESSNDSSIEEISHLFSNNNNNNMLGQPDLSQTQPTLSGDDNEDEDQDQNEVRTPEQSPQMPFPDTKDPNSVQSSPMNLIALTSIPTRVSLESSSHNPPRPRWGHTMTSLGPNRFLVYGGQTIHDSLPVTLDDLHIFDDNKRWIQPLCTGMKRQWHTATYLPERQLLIAFGGEVTQKGGGNAKIVHPVMVLDTEIMLWYPPSVSGDIPKGRSGHTATLLGHELVVWGGVSSNKWLQRVSVLDTVRWVWYTPVVHGTAPRPRSYHTATACGNKHRMVVFGGNDAEQCFQSVHVLERTMRSHQWEWSNVQTTGSLPSPRTGHSAVLLKDGTTICIYGGWDPNGDGDDVLFGDSFLLNTETWVWSKGPWEGTARVGHGAVLDADGSHMLVFGGRCTGDEFTNDLLVLDV